MANLLKIPEIAPLTASNRVNLNKLEAGIRITDLSHIQNVAVIIITLLICSLNQT